MKYILATFLFFTFASSMVGVRYADGQSQLYSACADYWLEAVEEADTKPYLKEYLRKQLSPDNTVRVEGQACPALLPKHREIIETRLSAETGLPVLRGLNQG